MSRAASQPLAELAKRLAAEAVNTQLVLDQHDALELARARSQLASLLGPASGNDVAPQDDPVVRELLKTLVPPRHRLASQDVTCRFLTKVSRSAGVQIGVGVINLGVAIRRGRNVTDACELRVKVEPVHVSDRSSGTPSAI